MGLIFDGVDLEIAFGVEIDGADTWPKPERDRELIHVPGRNGDIIMDNGCWQNVPISYRILIKDGWIERYEEFMSWLCAHVGYFRLEDPKRHPGVYRMAEYVGPTVPELWFYIETGVIPIDFNCKPQQFLTENDKPLQRLLPVSMLGLGSCYLPVSGDSIKYIPTIDSSVSGSVKGKINVYDIEKELIETSGDVVLSDGVSVSFTITANGAAYWRIVITTNDAGDNDLVSFRVIGSTIVDGAPMHLDAVLARSFSYHNPTGYATKPLFHLYGETGWYMALKQYDRQIENWQKYWFWNISNFSAKSSDAYMDCEMQYLYCYQTIEDITKKASLGGYLTMTESTSNLGEALVFPEFGEKDNMLELYTLSAADLGLLLIYPRWWRV